MEKLSLNELSGNLQAHEARLNKFAKKVEDKTFQIKGQYVEHCGTSGNQST